MSTYTVKELIEVLKQYPDELPVVFSYPSGDYWHTELAGQVQAVDEGQVAHSEYHRKLQVIDCEECQENGKENCSPDHAKSTTALILSSF